ncbi:hypothetical protein [Albirhodobacter sp. R86504]|uniref:hypothetical protein n=1 Tax=Albirhodobacter sp. R86504 TaxID=3093848 RepID=UPI003670A5BE
MSDNPTPSTSPKPTDIGPEADFAWQVEILFEVLGPTHSPRELSFSGLAAILGVNPSGITQRCNGKTVLKPSEASRIIAGYGLNAHLLDASLFDLTDPVAFRAELKNQGVGVYGSGPRLRLARELDARLVRKGLTVEMRALRAPQRGVTYGSDPTPPILTFHVGEHVEIKAQGAAGRHVALLQSRRVLPHAIDVLSPTAVFPETLLMGERGERGRMILPQDKTEDLEIRRPTDQHRIIAVEGPEELVQLFGEGDAEALVKDDDTPLGHRPVAVTDISAARILSWLQHNPDAEVRTADLEFLVVNR